MKTELLYLVLVTVLTALLWIPLHPRPGRDVGPDRRRRLSEKPKAQSPWATRMLQILVK